MRHQFFALPLVMFSLCLVTVPAQVVPDGATNTLANVTNIVAGPVTVGTNGSFTLLQLTNGALLTNSGHGTIGAAGGANRNAVRLTGGNTRWSMSGDLFVGSNGAFNELVISNGALVGNTFGNIGSGAASSNNLVFVTGMGSLWSNRDGLFVGLSGSGNRLMVSDGAVVRNENGFIGGDFGSSNNTAWITGPGSLWSNRFSLSVGLGGNGNRLVVSNGAVVTGGSAVIGAQLVNGNEVLVTGAGSRLSIQGAMEVGRDGTANRLIVEAGGGLQSQSGLIGRNVGSGSHLAVVSGPGSYWTNSLSLTVGNAGGGNRLVVSNGGTVFAGVAVYLGSNSASINNNRLIVDGGTLRVTNVAGTGFLDVRRGTNVLNNGVIEVDQLVMTNAPGAFELNGGTLITRGAAISNGSAFLVGTTGTTPAVWDVRAGASNHLVNGNLLVGAASAFNQLLITNGALLTNRLGGGGGIGGSGDSNAAVIAGVGSRWLMPGNLIVGSNSSFNRLVVSNGAQVRSQTGYVGLGGTGNEAVITGAGSLWTNGGNLEIGSVLGGNRLRIADGAVVYNGSGFIGTGSGSTDNEVLVTGSGALWSNRVTLLVGSQGSQNRLVVSNGGTVVTPNLYLGAQASSMANRVVVDGGALRVVGPGQYDLRRGTNVLNSGLVEAHVLMVTNATSAFDFNGGTLITRTTTNDNGRLFRVGNGLSPATLQLDGGTHLFANTLLINSNAALTGSGYVFGTITNRGNISPGTSAGALRAGQTLRLTASSMMTFEIGGLIPTNEHDVVTIGGLVEFAGTLSLSLLNSFLPDSDDTFTLISYGTSLGSFANLGGGRVSLTNNLASFAVTQTATNFTLGGVSYVDNDGDGQPDLFEQAAGTDASDSASALAILSVAPNASGHNVVQFQSVAGKSYRIEWSNELVVWTAILSPSLTMPMPGVSQWIDDGTLTGGLPDTARYYRVGLQ